MDFTAFELKFTKIDTGIARLKLSPQQHATQLENSIGSFFSHDPTSLSIQNRLQTRRESQVPNPKRLQNKAGLLQVQIFRPKSRNKA